MKNRASLSLIFLLAIPCLMGYSQESFTKIEGTVSDSSGAGIYLVNVIIKESSIGSYTDESGYFSLTIPRNNKSYVLKISSISYDTIEYSFTANVSSISLDLVLQESITSLNEVVIRERALPEAPTMKRLAIRNISHLPSSGSIIESLLKTMPGVNSPNELSAQYSVRGGSYDENLVYLNGMEMYKPQLIKSGRKEGLSTINSDLVGSIYFSPGGFNVTYGDKMSSVLDITYRDPDEFRGSINLSLLNSSAHIEGSSANDKITFLAGVRYMTNRFLLRTLDTQANYTPYFYDIQSLTSIKTGANSSLSLFFTYGNNKYEFIPLSQRSTFGTYQEAYQLYVDYEGFENDEYATINGALSWEWLGSDSKNKLMLQAYSSHETESFDIRGRYSLNLLDKDIGSENLGDSLMNVGIGSWLDHARNIFDAKVYIASFNSRWQHSNNVINWGIKLKHEVIDDELNEWRMIDSAGYSIPYSTEGLELYQSIYASNSLSSTRLELYISDNYTIDTKRTKNIITGGVRLSYWTLNRELIISPRFSYKMEFNNNISAYFSSGIFYQPPFYREMRYPDGNLNYNIKSQKSTHFVLGTDWDFKAGQTPFRISAEVYHKVLDNLIPYKFDNVRVLYSAENIAIGTVNGIDIRIFGEFVSDAESWLSLSLMKASHDIINDDQGPYPAPADIRFSGDLFFQDYLPSNPSYRAHLKMHFSTGLPISSPYDKSYDNYYRMPSYRRLDLGFTKTLKDRFSYIKASSPLNYFESIVIGFEIFNLLDINNTISYHWLTTINNLSGEERQFAVPNYLTGRSLNFKLRCTF